jgi:hypothetical protein
VRIGLNAKATVATVLVAAAAAATPLAWAGHKSVARPVARSNAPVAAVPLIWADHGD